MFCSRIETETSLPRIDLSPEMIPSLSLSQNKDNMSWFLVHLEVAYGESSYFPCHLQIHYTNDQLKLKQHGKVKGDTSSAFKKNQPQFFSCRNVELQIFSEWLEYLLDLFCVYGFKGRRVPLQQSFRQEGLSWYLTLVTESWHYNIIPSFPTLHSSTHNKVQILRERERDVPLVHCPYQL